MLKRKSDSSTGSAIMVVVFSTSLLLVFITTAFTRVSSRLASVSRQGDINRAFQIAQAGLDDRLTALTGVPPEQALGLIMAQPSGPMYLSGDTHSRYTYQYLDDGDAGTANGIKLQITGIYKNSKPQTIEAGIAVGGSGSSCENYINPLFKYATAGTHINMDGDATVGDAANNQAKLYAAGPPANNQLFITSNSNQVWASEISFYNPTNQPLTTVCPNCNNPGIFHPSIAFNSGAAPVNVLTLNLKPYYDQAVAEGHVITSDTTFNDQALSGVYYVECGNSILFKGNSSLRGTLVHEGCNGDIKIAANGTLAIDSISGTQFDKGAAILGAPSIQFGGTTTIDISGIVMHSGAASTFAPMGSIRGTFLGIDATAINSPFDVQYPDYRLGPGPGNYPKLEFHLDPVHIGGSAHVIFDAQAIQIKADVPPDSCSNSGSAAPTVLYWRRL